MWLCLKIKTRDFPGVSVVKSPPADAGETGSIPGLGRFHIPRSHEVHVPQGLMPLCPGAHVPPQEKPPQGEV